MKKIHLKKPLLRALREGKSIQESCNIAGIGINTFYRWKREDFDFNFSTEAAIKIAQRRKEFSPRRAYREFEVWLEDYRPSLFRGWKKDVSEKIREVFRVK